MTVEQFISDLDDLVEAVCERLGKTNVVIYGHSWGSALGVLYAARFPEKVAAYVGSGQIGDWPAAEATSYEFALAEAQRLGNRRAIRKLQSIGPPPYSANAVFTERTWLSRFEGRMRPRAPVEGCTSRSRRAGVLDPRAARRNARLPVLHERDVG